jgi:hypothetical protein
MAERRNNLGLPTQRQQFHNCYADLNIWVIFDCLHERLYFACFGHQEKQRKRVICSFTTLTGKVRNCIARKTRPGQSISDFRRRSGEPSRGALVKVAAHPAQVRTKRARLHCGRCRLRRQKPG